MARTSSHPVVAGRAAAPRVEVGQGQARLDPQLGGLLEDGPGGLAARGGDRDLATRAVGDHENQAWDIGPGSQGAAWEPDGDGDATWAGWDVPELPVIGVHRNGDAVDGHNWPLGAMVTVTIDDRWHVIAFTKSLGLR